MFPQKRSGKRSHTAQRALKSSEKPSAARALSRRNWTALQQHDDASLSEENSEYDDASLSEENNEYDDDDDDEDGNLRNGSIEEPTTDRFFGRVEVTQRSLSPPSQKSDRSEDERDHHGPPTPSKPFLPTFSSVRIHAEKVPQQTQEEVSKPDPATPFKSAKQKQLSTVLSTISDDRSRGSEFVRTGRIYKALLGTDKESQPQKADTTENQGKPVTEATSTVPAKDPGSVSPPVRTGPVPHGGANHALQDYQMQLMLLEQQNKKRLMMARQEQESMQHADMSAYSHLSQSLTSARPARSLPNLQKSATKTALPQSFPIAEATGPGPHDASSATLHNDYNSEQESDSIPVAGQTIQGTNGSTSYAASLPSALELIARALKLKDESALTMESLQAFASELEAKKDSERPIIPRAQVIHRVSPGKEQRMYLDAPQWIEGAQSSRDALVGNLLIRDIPAYLSKHPEVCFIIYRDYDISRAKKDNLKDEEDYIHQGTPEHSAETIESSTDELMAAIDSFLEHYGFNLHISSATEPTKLSAPYVDIYHTRDDMEEFLQTLDDEQQSQFQVLLNYVHLQYEEEYCLVDEMTSRGKITYAYIKYLFKPGDVVVRENDQKARGYLCRTWLDEPKAITRTAKVSDRRSEINSCALDTWHWEFDGFFSRKQTLLNVTFDIKDISEQNIDDLNIRPLKYVNESTAMRLQHRGEWIWKCRVRHMVSYNGDDNGTGFHGSNDERYMIDMMMYRELHQSEPNSKHANGFASTDDLGSEKLKQNDPPDDKFIYLMPMTIKGYNLKRKKWLDLQVDRIRQIVWNTRAFDSLVLNGKTKRLIQALISSQIESERSTDLINGKGNGLILLLHGAPGTGKTLTAESVAEIAEKPLYPVTCGDIGTEPEEVETYLESVLHIGKTWGCVVLLDEADVFLEQRSLEDLRRNALVSVFLRVLEYYDGILVLTSNRVGTFDEAFKSRIQLAIHYNNLTLYQRTQIWGNFIRRLEELQEEAIDFVDLRDNIERLADNKMNGREIRNVITTARQYARWERKQPGQQTFQLDYEVMDGVIKVAGEFDKYIQELNGGFTHDQLAEDVGIR